MARYQNLNDYDYHDEILNAVADSAVNHNPSKSKKKRLIRKVLEEYNIDIAYNDHVILTIFVCKGDFKGTHACLELGGDPAQIMDDEFINEMKYVNIIRMDGLFRSFGCVCEWSCDLDSLHIDSDD